MSSSPRENLLARRGDRCRRGGKSALTVTLPGQAHPLVTAEAKFVICDQTIDELQRRHYNPDTIRGYLHAVQEFAEYFGRSPERLGSEEVRAFQLHMILDKKLA